MVSSRNARFLTRKGQAASVDYNDSAISPLSTKCYDYVIGNLTQTSYSQKTESGSPDGRLGAKTVVGFIYLNIEKTDLFARYAHISGRRVKGLIAM